MITFKELSEKVVSVAQRKKMARRMSKLQKSAGFQLKKKRNSLRVRDTAKLTVIAKKKDGHSYEENGSILCVQS